jgi:2',3'-cyclic-nucleotide 2'-phosphodiesterase
MKVLYLGDIMAQPGMDAVERLLPSIKKDFDIDLVIAQAENVTDGKGVSPKDFDKLKSLGIDFCTGGNWTLHIPEINSILEDPKEPIIRPANYPAKTPGLGWKYVKTDKGNVLVISLLGKIVGRDANKEMDNPLKKIDEILESESQMSKVATIVNFHGDYSSEKLVVGLYLDGRVSAVIGDHWHIPTADAMVLPKGTAHISDVGMCGTIYSSLGVRTETIVKRWRDGKVSKNDIEKNGPLQLNAVIIDIDLITGLSRSINQVIERI